MKRIFHNSNQLLMMSLTNTNGWFELLHLELLAKCKHGLILANIFYNYKIWIIYTWYLIIITLFCIICVFFKYCFLCVLGKLYNYDLCFINISLRLFKTLYYNYRRYLLFGRVIAFLTYSQFLFSNYSFPFSILFQLNMYLLIFIFQITITFQVSEIMHYWFLLFLPITDSCGTYPLIGLNHP